MRKLLFVLISLLAINAEAQIPSTDIWLFDLENGNGKYTLNNAVNITDRNGYDNQPTFSNDDKYIYFSSVRDSIQSDIYRYDIKKKETKQITNTKESEYSPTITPDGLFMTVVRVDQDSAQRLYKQFPDGKKPVVLLTTSDTVGYHTWLNKNLIAIFALGDPHTLRIANIKDQRTTTVASNIGRCIQKIPGQDAFSYVDKTDSTHWKIMQFDLPTQFSKPLVDVVEGSEDYVWTTDGKILMGTGGLLYAISPFLENPTWKIIADLRKTDAENFYRISINSDGSKISLVVYRTDK